MTVFTLLAATSFVCIVFGMTAVAVRRHVVELPFDVAADAGVFPVLADQREVGCIVIELDLGPPGRRVTSGALGTQRLVVRVVVFVTVDTLRRRFAMLLV